MRILVVGAGSIGGYFGARLLAAGRDVTFLVRPGRAAALGKTGLCVLSPAGDITIAEPKLVSATTITEPFDVVLLSCKAYDLEAAIESLAPAMGPDSVVLPMLNGMAHMAALDARFGADHVLGGLCLISTMLDPEGRIRHLAPMATLSLGVRMSGLMRPVGPIAEAFEGAGFDFRLSEDITQAMWEKWMFISVAAGLTCLARGTIGDLMAAGGAWMAEAMVAECAAILTHHGHPPAEATVARCRTQFTTPGSMLTASMFRDLEQGGRIEAEQILGDLLAHGEGVETPVLRTATTVVRTYEARRARELAAHAHP
jgi:2-dehydropantoate 2-reductase